MKRLFLFCTALLLACTMLFAGAGTAYAQTGGDEPAPTDVTSQCEYDCSVKSKYLRARLANLNIKEKQAIEADGWISITWDDADVDYVCYSWTDVEKDGDGIAPRPYTVCLLDQKGAVIEKREGEPYWNCCIAIEDNVHGVRLKVSEKAILCTLMAFSGSAPSDFHLWRPTPDKLDFLVIATHPDDDTLFMGNIVPTYGGECGFEGSILYMATRERIRRTEALNGAWIMGLRTYPMMAGLPDIPMKYREKYKKDFLPEDVERQLVRYLRRVRPEVVITHDDNGEYGHWQHKIVAAAARLAVVDAADPAYDPESAEAYGVWQVKKLYLHLAEENPIFISATEPLRAFDGRTGWEVAQEAYLCHQSQYIKYGTWNHLCDNQNENSLERFGLVFTTVGLDTGINNMFEHTYLCPEPTPEPTEEPTPEPTEEPTPEPTPTPLPIEEDATGTETAIAEPVQPVQTKQPEPPQTAEEPAQIPYLWLAVAGALVAAAIVGIVVLIRKRKD